ncbi:MAG: hypothetical protein WAV41_01630 [Microgenomates group bacterium]
MKRITVEFSQKQANQLYSYGVALGDDRSINITQHVVRELYRHCTDAEKKAEKDRRSPTFWQLHDQILRKIDDANLATFESSPRRKSKRFSF